MESFLLVILVVLFFVILIQLNRIYTRLNHNTRQSEENLRKLNDKIDYLNKELKEGKHQVAEEKPSVFEDLKTWQPPQEIKREEVILESEPENIPEKETVKTVINSGYVLSESVSDKQEQRNSSVQEPAENKKKALDLEKLFGENILSKIGITTLVLGIAYFVKYAIDQNWIGEAGRVAIGILTGLGIIGIAHKLRAKYLSFSALLAGGGISVLYITITLAYRQYELFSQTTAFIILVIITILSVILSLYYNQKILAVFSILGGFASPLMVSSETGNYITLFSYIFLLNTGMLVLAYRKKWLIVSLLSYFLTYIFYEFWLLTSSGEKERTGAIIFSILFFIQFYVLVLIEYFKIRKITPYQVFIILTNNFLLYLTLFYIFSDYHTNLKGIITLAMAGINAVPVVMLTKMKGKDKLFFHLLLGIVITFVSLAAPIQLKGSAITMFWGAEAVLVLWLFRRTGIKVFKLSFIILEILALISLFIDYVKYYIYEGFFDQERALPVILNPVFITGVLIIICLYLSLYLLKSGENQEKENQKKQISPNSFLFEIFGGTALFLIFIFPFTELTYQLYIRNYPYKEMALIQGIYVYLFAAGYALITWNREKRGFYWVTMFLSVLYSTVYLGGVVSQVIRERFYEEGFSYGLFSLHFFTVPAFIALIIYFCRKNTRSSKDIVYWIAAIVLVMALSIEIDNVVLMVYEEKVLGNVHTIVYPVVWGFTALILIIAGMKYKKVILRKISLALFALIILKLYLYDVWKMPQAGKIISFIVLGLILLGVSFLYQRLKILVKNDEEKENNKLEID